MRQNQAIRTTPARLKRRQALRRLVTLYRTIVGRLFWEQGGTGEIR